MPTRGSATLHIAATSRRTQVVPDSVLGMLLFILTEVMMFAGLISAFSIARATAPLWPPPGQPRLPWDETALNTVALLASGVCLVWAHRVYRRRPEAALRPLGAAIALGAFFVVFQGSEWVALIAQGLTLTSSTLGSFFYLTVGLHALHAVIALGLLASAFLRLRGGWLASSRLAAAEVFWYFVVGIWPVIYTVVYS